MKDVFTVNIDKLAFGGSGVGRMDGKVCFVPFSCPGDELQVQVVAEKRSYLTARILEVLTPSLDRTEPRCPLFGACGGCGWQHIKYPEQLAAKKQMLAETMWRGVRVPDELVAATVASPLPFGYRNRAQFKLHYAAGRLHIGFYRHGSHFVEDTAQGCPVVLPVINDALQAFRRVLATFPEPAAIPQINIDAAEHGTVAVVNYIGRDPGRAAAFFAGHADALTPLTGLYLQTGRKSTMIKVWGDGLLAYFLAGSGDGTLPCKLYFPPGGFSQVNILQNRAILELIRKLADFKGHERLLDLYCGNGNFSLPVAGEVAEVIGVEEYKESIAAAVDNSRRNGINNARFTVSDAAAAVCQFAASGESFDVVMLDPPRSGAAETVRKLHRLKPSRIIYISCDPSTLARDCAILLANGYHVRSCIPVDMFPQTFHVESITMFQQ